MQGNQILDELGEGGNSILDEVGERGEVDIVEDQMEIGETHDDAGEKGKGRIPAAKGLSDREWTKTSHPTAV